MSEAALPMPGEAILALSPYEPGLTIEEIRQRYNLATVIKLASNENPLGTPPLAQDAIREFAASAFRYPRQGNPRLAKAIAARHDVGVQNIVIGNGSDEIIDLLIRLFASKPEAEVLCFQPCFGIYPVQTAINGAKLVRWPLNNDFSFNFKALLEKANPHTSVVFLTTPDNPSGFCPALAEVKSFADELRQKAPSALLVIDEAYADFADDEKAISMLAHGELPENTVFLRTFSKSYGLAGMRVGYAVMPARLSKYFWAARLPFSVNLLAEEAALAALKDDPFREATLRTVRQERAWLASELAGLGCKTWPSSANFLMFSLPQPSLSAADCHEKLLQNGIIIRRLGSYNLPNHLRVSVGSPKENRAFIKALAKILATTR